MSRQTYAEKLRDPRWQKKRLEILDRDGWRCRHCQSDTNTLHVHHTWYERGADPWDYPDSCLVTLCEFCHEDESVSVIEESFAELVMLMRREGATSWDAAALCSVFDGIPDYGISVSQLVVSLQVILQHGGAGALRKLQWELCDKPWSPDDPLLEVAMGSEVEGAA